MSNKLTQPSRDSYATDEAYRDAMQVFGTLRGQNAWAGPVDMTGYDDDAGYAVTIFNGGAAGKHLNINGLLLVNNAGVHVSTFDAVTATITTLNATTANITTANVTTLNVSGVSTLHATSVTSLTATGNVSLGDADADVHTIIGVSTFRNAANSATQLLVDAGNNRVVVGSGTALGTDTTPNLQVVGRLYVAPESANDHAIQIRRSSAETVGWWVGAASAGANSDLVFKDDGDTERFRIGDASSTNQAKVTGQLQVTNGIVVLASGINVTGGITVASAGVDVTGASTFRALVTINSGGLAVSSGGITLSGPTNIDGNGGTAGQIRIGAVIVNTASLSAGENLRVNGTTLLDGQLTISTGGANITGGLAVSSTAIIADATYIGDTSNADITLGLTINQGGADNQILAVKSSDVAHGMTTVTETDTYGYARKIAAATGGLQLVGLDGTSTVALFLRGFAGAESTARSTAAVGPVVIDASLKSGTTIAALGTANANLFVVRNNGTAEFLVDREGDIHMDATSNINAWDDHEDVALLEAYRVVTAPGVEQNYRQRFSEDIAAHARVLADTGVLTLNEDGRHFVSMKGLHGLLIDALRQCWGDVQALRSEVRALRAGT